MALLDTDKRFDGKKESVFISNVDGSRNVCVYYSAEVGEEGYKMLDGIESVEFEVDCNSKAKNTKKVKSIGAIYPLD